MPDVKPKVLEAARHKCPGSFLTDDRLEEAIQAAFDAADLVPRSELEAHKRGHEGATKILNARRVRLGELKIERDGARHEAEELARTVDQEMAEVELQTGLAETRGKMLAALREALEGMLEDFGAPYDGHLSVETARAVIADTAKAAAQYQRVPEGWGVFPVESTEQMRESAMDKDGGDYAHDALGYYEDIWDHMIAAAPTATPDPEDGW